MIGTRNRHYPYLALQVSVGLILFILLLYNMGGWLLWQLSLRWMDDRLSASLFETGRSLQVTLESLSPSIQADPDSEGLLEAMVYLDVYSEESGLKRIFLFNRDNRVIYDSAREVEWMQEEPLLDVDRRLLARMWTGEETATPFYPAGPGFTKRAYLPVRDEEGEAAYGLALEAGSSQFIHLLRLRRVLLIMTLSSLALAIISVAVIVQVVRRARRIEQIMERTERAMEAGQLTAALGHELRNPLGILHTNAEVLKDRVPEEDRETVQDMIEEIGRLDDLIRRFLDLSSQKPGQWTRVQPVEILEKAVNRNRKRLTEAGIECQIKNEEGVGPVSGQPDRLLRVFDNLIENALQALEGRQNGQISILISRNRKSVIIEIQDNGPGFSTEALEHALQPFYTSRPKGSGIGLALCRRIIEDHGGRLALKNLSPGASVEIRLPKAD